MDHPHIHGEHSLSENFDTSTPGSPPYTWGAQSPCNGRQLCTRITPIYMGSTSHCESVLQLEGDHPHIHGEHNPQRPVPSNYEGSPPYTWGALEGMEILDAIQGITPIYMGSTKIPSAPTNPSRDHPHIHGEHCTSLRLIREPSGSPPYTWGALTATRRDKPF